ncbi:CAZyme family GH16 [Trichoderma aggressivum f. europaeum]|uniref:CAZyme family GH16 n=1 Tax=Trichoderma aggressivum f. europaeum TaxID=173218 RepID=A0AAE1M5H5_9HYPO|nr:CAZyme family GH16 [Trichoderma aggressivum f. europaeum]
MEYFLSTTYAGESLLSGFNWFDGLDPSHGFVSYQSRQNAHAMGLYQVDDRTGVVRLGVDSTNNYSVSDRVWTYGDNWPYDGEIDIIEGVNTAHTNIISAHTADGCIQGNDILGLFSGEQINTECAVGTDNIGCGFHPSSEDTSSYGDGFNAAHGGVYAMQWDHVHIRIWHFPRGSIPRDIEAKRPDPDTWGQPIAIFGGSQCRVDSYFKNMRLVLNIREEQLETDQENQNFCGDYGDAVWGKTDQCDEFAPTCDEYVARNPEAFTNAYWDVQYIDAYEYRPRVHDPWPSWNSTQPKPSWNLTLPRPRPGPDSDELTTTLYKTTRWTETVTVFATGHVPHRPWDGQVPAATTDAIEPVATRAPVNPIKINHYSYLGCFYSNSGFDTFREVADSRDMTLERCVDLCNKKTYVGIFDSHCFCADSLDAETMATKKEGLCNKQCPGNNFEFCGGIVTPRDIDAPRQKFVSETLPLHALTVYGCVEDEKLEAPPAMAPGSNWTEKGWSKTITEVTEVTVFPVSEQDSREKGWQWGDKHEGDYEWSGHKSEKNDWQQDEGEKHKDDKHKEFNQSFDGDDCECDDQGGGGHDWNNHKGHNEGDWKESASWDPITAEEKNKQEKSEMSEIVIPVTETVVDCPETKEAVVTPTWLPHVDPKPWVSSDPPPASPLHDVDSHDPPSHGDDHDKSRPPPSTFPETPVSPPVVLVAGASTMYAGLEKYLAILGLSILVLTMRIF